ncbi:M48 family metallopeptidase [Acetobacter fallax]|uniref:DUF45 domain-containing protein n=1 Tax=Acetobacter fallax TaxID=1737473 RepID=A0ABX0KDN2_9PROT|nr:SprT family zinc-dependent metalloprotease [Acetobacter fallax]NHO32580.1 DUF45 domain-containing protein [Acetobacter fallax]NHO36075.1 DUF45 domain-containing protein [Acetobacter fallax]
MIPPSGSSSVRPAQSLPCSIAMPDGPVPVEWRRSTRARRVSLRVSPRTRGVIVTLPASATTEAGLRLLRTHTGWIEKQLQRRAHTPRFEAGGRVPIDGADHVICHTPHGTGGAWLEQSEIHVSGDAAFIPRRVTDFLRRLATRKLADRMTALGARTGLMPAQVAIRDTTSRWGSCTARGRVMLSWRLVMTPVFVQDYVILHELAHLRHLNHSAAFWALVDLLTPRRHEAERWLKLHGAALLHAGAGHSVD